MTFIKNWLEKLVSRDDELRFSVRLDELADELAGKTEDFSFAFLKELFVSSFLDRTRMIAAAATGEDLLRLQLERLKKQVKLQEPVDISEPRPEPRPAEPETPSQPQPTVGYNILLGLLLIVLLLLGYWSMQGYKCSPH